MYVSSFHSVSPCFVTSFEQVFCTVTSCLVTNETNETDHQWELLLVCFICPYILAKKSICFIVTLRYTLFRNKHWPRCLNCFILFRNKWNEWNRPSVRIAIGLFHLFHSFSVHFRVFLIYFNCYICFCYGEKNVPKKNLRGFCAVSNAVGTH